MFLFGSTGFHPLTLITLDSISDDMLCYASSAMDDVISAGVLRGRPFGGVAIFVKNSICSGVKLKLICKNSIFIILLIGGNYRRLAITLTPLGVGLTTGGIKV